MTNTKTSLERRYSVVLIAVTLCGAAVLAAPAAVPVDLNTPRSFPEIASRAMWEDRARDIREQALVSCGLWPLTERPPLNARIFDRIERDGYSIEKVWVETLPGFFLGGNLYCPIGKGPFPAILNPHGHWTEGRLVDNPQGSVPARCISFARQGMIAFAYDMVGYNDTRFAGSPKDQPGYVVHRWFGTNQADLLWNISLMGLQTWNSLRALDFLETVPRVDRKRLGMTGASGGGTQTFMLGAIDDRLAAQAPIVMVSHTMQGGCSCENAPGLRVQYSNMEFAAAAAPRPQILVAATGDWTKATLTVEGPAIEHIYRLFGRADQFQYLRFDYGHNYNRETRETVYRFLGRTLLNHPEDASLKELPYQKEPDASLRVFVDTEPPKAVATQAEIAQTFKNRHRDSWRKAQPRSEQGLESFGRVYYPVWRHTLQLEQRSSATHTHFESQTVESGILCAKLTLRRPDEHESLAATFYSRSGPVAAAARKLAVLVADPADHPSGLAGGAASETVRELTASGFAVLSVDRFTSEPDSADVFANFYSTYNRTRLQQRVRDLVTICSAAPAFDPRGRIFFRVYLVGHGSAGTWALLAAPAADGVVADASELDWTSEETWFGKNLFCPGILALGGPETSAILATPKPLMIHNTSTESDFDSAKAAYRAATAGERLQVRKSAASVSEWVAWLRQNS